VSLGFSFLHLEGIGRDYGIEDGGFISIYGTAGYPELCLCGVLILSRKMSVSSRNSLSVLFLSIPSSFHQRRACYSNKEPDRQPDCY
jgi:hypothetical protein